jgi:hypothetical protein
MLILPMLLLAFNREARIQGAALRFFRRGREQEPLRLAVSIGYIYVAQNPVLWFRWPKRYEQHG